MRSASISLLCLSTALLASAAGAEPSQRRDTNEPPATSPGALERQRRDLAPVGSPENRWRYSFYHGHWWYYRDGGRWAYFTGLEWVDYEPRSYRLWYIRQEMTDLDARLARFDARMRPYLSGSFSGGSSGGPLLLSEPDLDYGFSPWLGGSATGGGLFYPRAFDGRLNPATSIGGYMGGILRAPLD